VLFYGKLMANHPENLKPFVKGDDPRRHLNPRKGTGVKDRIKKMAEEIEKTLPDLTADEINAKIIVKLTAQALTGDLDSIKLLSKFVPISTPTSIEEFKKISEKKLTKRSSALLDSFSERKITQEESAAYAGLLQTAIDNEVIPEIEARVTALEKPKEDK